MKRIKLGLPALLLFVLITHSSCDDEQLRPTLDLETVWEHYEQLPEALTTISRDSSWLATYILPTDRYGHAILGDGIEAGGVVLYHAGQYYEFVLPQVSVFEDLAPRFIDVNQDEVPELLCIKSGLDSGAGLVIYQLENNELLEYAYTDPIGWANSWLNPVAVSDLDRNGSLDLLWIQTPHVGGVLKSTQIRPGLLEVIDDFRGVSNHALDERNLCLSALIEQMDSEWVLVPNQSRDSIFYFSYQNGFFTKETSIAVTVDFGQPLYEQVTCEVWLNDNNCLSDW
ncbi:MAG: VCBS repeat-containing protein [Bacteroidota bacterium]